MLKLLTYNVQHGKKLHKIFDWLEKRPEKPDIICFQEFPKDYFLTKSKLFFSDYNHKFKPSYSKKGKIYGEMTAYKNKKFRVTFSKVLNLGTSRIEQLVFRHSGERTALLTGFEFAGKEIVIANIHLQCIGLNCSRRKQIKLILDQMNKSIYGVIIGDFNYTNLFSGSGLSSFLRSRGFIQAVKNISTHNLIIFEHQLDYIFQKNLTVNQILVDKVKFSDHYPLFATLNL